MQKGIENSKNRRNDNNYNNYSFFDVCSTCRRIVLRHGARTSRPHTCIRLYDIDWPITGTTTMHGDRRGPVPLNLWNSGTTNRLVHSNFWSSAVTTERTCHLKNLPHLY